MEVRSVGSGEDALSLYVQTREGITRRNSGSHLCSKQRKTLRDSGQQQGYGAEKGAGGSQGLKKRLHEEKSFFSSYREASALGRLLLELQFRGWRCNPAFHLCFIPSPGELGYAEYHSSGRSITGRFSLRSRGEGTFPQGSKRHVQVFLQLLGSGFNYKMKSVH